MKFLLLFCLRWQWRYYYHNSLFNEKSNWSTQYSVQTKFGIGVHICLVFYIQSHSNRTWNNGMKCTFTVAMSYIDLFSYYYYYHYYYHFVTLYTETEFIFNT